jgi:hypothetical protein
VSDIPQAVGGTSNPHIDAYLAALNSYLDIDGAWRRELADATDAVNAKWEDRKSAAHRELLSAYEKVMPTHRRHAQEPNP